MTKSDNRNTSTKTSPTGAIIVGDRKGYRKFPLDGADELRLDRMFGLLDAAIEESARSKRADPSKAKK